MQESELIDGAEYEGDYTSGTRLVRGIIRRDMDYCCFTMGGDSRKRVTLWQDGGFGYHAWLDSLRPVSSTHAITEKDRLFEGNCVCCLCGKLRDWFRGTGPHPGAQYCIPCREKFDGGDYPAALDAEITRRKALAVGTQPPAAPQPTETPEPSAKAAPKCVACNSLVTAGSERCAYCAHRYTNHLRGKETVLPGRLSDVDDRIAQAKRQLDAAYPGKYKYAESSGCFSTATRESD